MTTALTTTASTFINMGLQKGLQNSGIEYVGKYGNVPISQLVQYPVVALGTVANVVVNAKASSDKKKLIAYYSHSRPKD